METNKLLKKFIVVFLSFLLVISMVPFGLFGPFNVKKPKAAEKYAPKDTFTITKVSDGTHNGPGTETFINSKNGYRVADDTKDDGVVASGDYVTYKFKLSVPAGPKRTIKVSFKQNNDALELADFGKTAISNSIIDSKWRGNAWEYTIARGATGSLEGIFSIKAKDTKGEVIKGNVITATLKNGDYEYVSKTEPVTVVSVPLADLTLSNPKEHNGVAIHDQHDTGGEFIITPEALHLDGYSKAGATASGKWHTDVDVSSFPKGTIWKLDRKDIPVTNGKLKNLTGTGSAKLEYTLPSNAIPSENNRESKEYIAFLEPYNDSFKVGTQYNVKDAGAGESKYYNTANFSIGGRNAHAVTGEIYPNNNYTADVWRYIEEPVGEIWRYDVYVARDRRYTLFDKENKYWSDDSEYYTQGTSSTSGIYGAKITSDHDMYSMLTINAKALRGINADKVVAGDTWNTKGVTGQYRGSHYDTTRQVVVTVGDEVLSPDLYKVEWRKVPTGIKSLDDNVSGASRWIETNQAPNKKVNQYRITFVKDAFNTDKNASRVRVYTPVKALDDYNSNKDMDKFVHSVGTFAINSKSTNKGVSGNDYSSDMGYDEVLQFPQKPQVKAKIVATDERPVVTEKDDKMTGTYTVHFKTEDKVSTLPTSFDYSSTRTLNFDDVYDVSTFKLDEDGDWEVVSKENHKVVLKKNNFDIEYNDIGNISFSIETIYGLNNKTLDKLNGSVLEKIELSYPEVGTLRAGTVSSNTSASYAFDTIRDIISVLEADYKKVEIDDNLSYTVKVMANTSGFSQDIYMPYNGDKKYMSMINKANKTNIDIDEKTGLDKNGIYDGIGRSKIGGYYIVESITLSNFANDTDVYFENGLTKIKLPVNKDGSVDTSRIKSIRLGNIDDAKLVVSSNKILSENQSSGFVANIKLKPVNNKVDDVYVMWLGATRKYNSSALLNNKIAWGDDIKVVDSSISGYVWNDTNGNGMKDDDEIGFSGVSVKLQKANSQGEYEDVIGCEAVTKQDGSYIFEGLHSHDKYRVVLKNIKRNTGKDEYITFIKGSSDKYAKDGSLPIGEENRFSVFEKTTQTYSYPNGYKKHTDSKSNIKLGIDEDLNNINFGFKLHNKDINLDKSEATVTKHGDISIVEWDVTVKNNSDESISGIKLNDRMSDKVVGVESSLGYLDIKKEITGNVVAVVGDQPLSSSRGSLIATTDGVWLVKKDDDLIKVQGIESTPVAVTGKYPLSSYYGSLVSTTKGAWLVKGDGSTIKVQNIEGAPVAVTGSMPLDLERGSLIATTKGAWLVKSDGNTVKVHGIEGVPVFVTGDYPLLSNFGSLIVTTEGMYLVKYDGSTIKVQNIEGAPVAVTGSMPLSSDYGSFIATTKGAWIVKPDGSTIKVQNIEGAPVAVTGSMPLFPNYGSLIVTTEGIYLVKSDGSVTKTKGIEGKPVAVVGDKPMVGGSLIATTDGVWLIAPHGYAKKVSEIVEIPVDITGVSPFSSRDGSLVATVGDAWLIKAQSFSTTYTATHVQNIIGKPIMTIGSRPLSADGSLIATTEGVWLIKSNGSTVTKLPVGAYYSYVQDQSISPTSTTKEGDWVNRQYELPTIQAGDTLTLHLKGTVINENKDFVVGNQAWVTSELTPRSGIKTSKVTGEGMSAGVPDIPVLPSVKDMKPDGIYGTPTVGINKDIDHDSTPADDLADQTPALIPGLPSDIPPLQQDGSLSGIAWFDKNKDGIRDSSEARAPNVKVTVRNQEHPNLFYETETNNKGEWKLTNLAYGSYEVHYDVLNYVNNNKHFEATKYGGVSNTDSDIDKSGFVTKEVEIEGNKIVSGACDAGLVDLNGKIKIIKAAKYGKDGKDDEDIVYGTEKLKDKVDLASISNITMDEKTGRVSDDDKSDLTQGYGFRIQNLGDKDLINVTVSDKTIKGFDSKMSDVLAYYEGSKLIGSVTIENNVLKKDGKPLVMKPNSYVTGALDVGFTKDASVHQDELSVSAAMLSEGSLVGSVKDSDGLTTKYVERPARMLKINKYGVANVDDKNKEKLEGVTFKLERVLNPYDEVKDYKFKSLGKYATDENGSLDVRLDAGKYKLTEVKAALGYNKPSDSGWFIDVSYDEAGNPKVKVASDASMPYIDKKDGEVDSSYWGSVDVYNYKLLSIPITGGKTLYLLIGGFGVVALGLFFRRKFAKVK